jgi:hypothetical protein
MPTSPYTLTDGTPIPGVTTVIGASLGWSKGALMYWAWQEGKAGRDYRKTQKDAADAGTIAHGMVEAAIHGRAYTLPTDATDEQLRQARLSFAAWDEWATSSRLTMVATEVKLVSERHRVGGTPDAIGLVNGRLSLPDWKTSKGIYAEYVIQLAAYEHLWEEITAWPLLGGIHCCRFDKVTGGFSHHWWPTEALRPAWEAFLRLRDLYDLQREMRALAA